MILSLCVVTEQSLTADLNTGIIIAIVYSGKITAASPESLHSINNTYTAAALFFGGLTVGESRLKNEFEPICAHI